MTLAEQVDRELKRLVAEGEAPARVTGLHSVVPIGDGETSVWFDINRSDVNEGTLFLVVPEHLVVGLDREALLAAVDAEWP